MDFLEIWICLLSGPNSDNCVLPLCFYPSASSTPQIPVNSVQCQPGHHELITTQCIRSTKISIHSLHVGGSVADWLFLTFVVILYTVVAFKHVPLQIHLQLLYRYYEDAAYVVQSQNQIYRVQVILSKPFQLCLFSLQFEFHSHGHIAELLQGDS